MLEMIPRKLSMRDVSFIICEVKIGTVLLIPSLLNKSKIKQVAIFVGNIKNNSMQYVAIAKKEKLELVTLARFLIDKRCLVVCSPKLMTDECEERIQIVINSFISIPSESKNEFENIGQIFDRSAVGIILYRRKLAIGKPQCNANTFLKDKHNFEIVYDSRKIREK